MRKAAHSAHEARFPVVQRGCMDILKQVASHARETYPADDFRHILEVVSYVRQLAAETGADPEIATIAAYFHVGCAISIDLT